MGMDQDASPLCFSLIAKYIDALPTIRDKHQFEMLLEAYTSSAIRLRFSPNSTTILCVFPSQVGLQKFQKDDWCALTFLFDVQKGLPDQDKRWFTSGGEAQFSMSGSQPLRSLSIEVPQIWHRVSDHSRRPTQSADRLNEHADTDLLGVLTAERLHGPGSTINVPLIPTGKSPEPACQKAAVDFALETESLGRLVGREQGEAALRLIGCAGGQIDMLDVISLFNLLNDPVDGLEKANEVRACAKAGHSSGEVMSGARDTRGGLSNLSEIL